jgi:hypothetical protein
LLLRDEAELARRPDDHVQVPVSNVAMGSDLLLDDVHPGPGLIAEIVGDDDVEQSWLLPHELRRKRAGHAE